MKRIDFNQIIERGSELSFYNKLAKDLVSFLEINNRGTFKTIIRFSGGSDRRTLRLLNEMIRLNLISYRNGYFFIKKPIMHYPIFGVELLCKECGGKLVSNGTKPYADLKEFFKKIGKIRP